MRYAERIAAAAGDAQALLVLAIELAGIVDTTTARRADRAAAKRQERARVSQMSRDVAQCRTTSRDIERQDATPSSPLPSSSFPTPHITTSFPPPSEQSESATDLAGAAMELRLALSTALGTRAPDVRQFLQTRRVETWPAWMRQMLKLVGPGSQYTADDLADACLDALTVDKPIEGPHALRAFIAKRRQERVAPSTAQRMVTVANAEEEAGERRRRTGFVAGRRAQRDGEEWWRRMELEATTAGRLVWTYAYDHLDEGAEAPIAV